MKRQPILTRVLGLLLALTCLCVGPIPVAHAAIITVTTPGDVLDAAASCSDVTVASLPGPDGVVSLREAMCAANNNAGPDIIEFDIPGCGEVCTIQPTSALPALTGGSTTIDGYTQPGALQATETASATLKIEIDGTNAGVYITGLVINSADNSIGGLVINRFSWVGVCISGSDAMGNSVWGSYVGTDVSGTVDQGNTYDGVFIGSGAQNNTIGGDTPGERNVISGNGGGVNIRSSGTMSNTVSGNYIGTDANGTAGLGNSGNGICIENNPRNNTIGGDTEGQRNVISNNKYWGIRVRASDGNTISGNYIGTDVSGAVALGNGGGVALSRSGSNTVGGPTPGQGNVICGNWESGISIIGPNANGNTVSGNYIGTDANGTAGLGNNGGSGIYIAWAENNTVGGATPGEGNVISGSGHNGIYIEGHNNTVSRNYIGIDRNGTALGNAWHGVNFGNAQNSVVGPGNVIAYNGLDGVEVRGSSTSGNPITQNSIFSNTMGIDLVGDANGGIAAPVIVTTTQGSVHVGGTACPGCTVEVFKNNDSDGEGETYVGDTIADASGAFTVTVSSLSKPFLTATATDPVSGTSEFSEVFTACTTALADVSISGPTSGFTGTLYPFTAVITPSDATPPIAYTWTPTPATGSGAVVTYTWATTGTKTITITAENCGGTVTGTHTITIETPPPGCPHPLEDISITGPTTGYTGTLYTFQAIITSTGGSATPPITYAWSPTPGAGQYSPVVTYTWTTTGTKVITVTGENCGGAVKVVSDPHTIIIEARRQHVYLPLVLRSFP